MELAAAPPGKGKEKSKDLAYPAPLFTGCSAEGAIFSSRSERLTFKGAGQGSRWDKFQAIINSLPRWQRIGIKRK